MNVIFRSAFAHDSQPQPQVSWCGGPSVTTHGHILVFLQGKINSARYIAQVVSFVLLSFLRQEGGVLLQQNNARPYTASATKLTLRGVQQLPDQQDPQISRQLNMYGT